ncbi:MAG: hypothetical protein C4570_03455, partial [Ammonifex sp.]
MIEASEILRAIKPTIVGWIEAAGGGGGPFAPSPHNLNGPHHTGTLDASQYPDALLRDGSRSITGNLLVETGIQIDGVDISAFKSAYDAHIVNPSAHHAPVTVGNTGLSLSGQQVSLALA